MAKSTKELARQLGFLRKRPLSSSSPSTRRKKTKIGDQLFPYLIIIDFESTCWENDRTCPQEIIEFPAVLLNLSTGEIESEFHHYLQPSERPTLSSFCQTLTGITQDQVDNGIPLSICLRKFSNWLRKLERDKGIVCVNESNTTHASEKKIAALVTWSDWDLGVCLLNETKRKQILRPAVLDRWIDLRATYSKFYDRRPDGLNGALKDLGIIFDGREHSGVDDARNTGRLAWRMACDGCTLNITKILKMSKFGSVHPVSVPLSTLATGSFEQLQSRPLISSIKHQNVSRNATPKPFPIASDPTISPANRPKPNISGKCKLSLRNTNIESNSNGVKQTQKSDSFKIHTHQSTPTRKKVYAGKTNETNSSFADQNIHPSLQGRKLQKESIITNSLQLNKGHVIKSLSIFCDSNNPSPSRKLTCVKSVSENSCSNNLSSETPTSTSAKSFNGSLSLNTPSSDSPSTGRAAVRCTHNTSGTIAKSALAQCKSVCKTSSAAISGISTCSSNTSFKTPPNTVQSCKSFSVGVLCSSNTTFKTPPNTTPSCQSLSRSMGITTHSNSTSFKTPLNNTVHSCKSFSKSVGVSTYSSNASFKTLLNTTPSCQSLSRPMSITTHSSKASFKTPLNTVHSCKSFSTSVGVSTYSSNTSFKTPPNTAQSWKSHSDSMKTPRLPNHSKIPVPNKLPPSVFGMKRTPPLCSCGRRTKRRLVQNQGPNVGRGFFSCPFYNGSRDDSATKKGCSFFQWETPHR